MTITSKEGKNLLAVINAVPEKISVKNFINFLNAVSEWHPAYEAKAKKLKEIITPLIDAEIAKLQKEYDEAPNDSGMSQKELNEKKREIVNKFQNLNHPDIAKIPAIQEFKKEYSDNELTTSEKEELKENFKNRLTTNVRFSLALLFSVNSVVARNQPDGDSQDKTSKLQSMTKEFYDLLLGENERISAGIFFSEMLLNPDYVPEDSDVKIPEEVELKAKMILYEAMTTHLASLDETMHELWKDKPGLIREVANDPSFKGREKEDFILLILTASPRQLLFVEQLKELKKQTVQLNFKGDTKAAAAAETLYTELRQAAFHGFQGGAEEFKKFESALKDNVKKTLSEGALKNHPDVLLPFLPSVLNTVSLETSISGFKNRSTNTSTNKPELIKMACSLKEDVKIAAIENPDSLEEIQNIIEHCNLILDNDADCSKPIVTESIQALNNHAEKSFSKKSAAWKAVGAGLAGFAFLSLVVGGLLAVPTGGIAVLGVAAVIAAVAGVASVKALETSTKVKKAEHRLPEAVSGLMGSLIKEKLQEIKHKDMDMDMDNDELKNTDDAPGM